MQRINVWDACTVSTFFQVHVLQISMGRYITALMCQEVGDTLGQNVCYRAVYRQESDYIQYHDLMQNTWSKPLIYQTPQTVYKTAYGVTVVITVF